MADPVKQNLKQMSTYKMMKANFCAQHGVSKVDRENKLLFRLIILDSYLAKAKNLASNPGGNIGQHLQSIQIALEALSKTPSKSAFDLSTSINNSASDLKNQANDRDNRLEALRKAILHDPGLEKEFKRIVNDLSDTRIAEPTKRGAIDALAKRIDGLIASVDNLVKTTAVLDKKLQDVSERAIRDTTNVTGAPVPVAATQTAGPGTRSGG